MPLSTIDTSSISGLGYGFKNRIINGGMTISQRIGTTQTTVADSTATYGLDRWRMYENTDGVLSVQQVSDAPVGFANSMKVTVTTADASLSAAQIGIASQRIEGFNFADFAWGTASAAPATLSFWVKSSVTGTHSGSFYDLNTSGGTRAYVFNYTVNAANTWEYKTVTVAGCTDGSWPTDSNGSLEIIFGLGTGTDYQTSSVNQWLTSFKSQSSGSVNLLNTLNATWQITGVQLEKGTVATSFDYRPYGTELALCQRYYQEFSLFNSRSLMGMSDQGKNVFIPNTPFSGGIMRSAPTASTSLTTMVIMTPGGFYPGVASLSSIVTSDRAFGMNITYTYAVQTNMMAITDVAPPDNKLKFSAEI